MQGDWLPAAANENDVLPPLPSPARIQELLFDAARLGRMDMLPVLLQAGADIDAADGKGHTALILASYHGHREATKLLLDSGAAVDRPETTRGNTALMGTAFKGYAEIAEDLLDAGADPNATNLAGQTALMMAALFGQSTVARSLIARGADAFAQDAVGNSAISVAEAQNNHAMAAAILKAARGR